MSQISDFIWEVSSSSSGDDSNENDINKCLGDYADELPCTSHAKGIDLSPGLVLEIFSSSSSIESLVDNECQIEELPSPNCKTELDYNEIDLTAGYATDENAIYVSADVYDREKANFDELVEKTLNAERRKKTLETKINNNDELIQAEQEVLKLNERLQLLSQYIDDLRVESKQADKFKKEPEAQFKEWEKPSWEHIYSGINRHRHKAGGSVAEFYQHKSNIISGLKTLYEPDGPPPSAAEFAEQPKALLVSLLKHQQAGLKWLLWRETQVIRGGILADDMGLGKTLSMVALILASSEKKQRQDPIEKDDFDYNKYWEKQLQLYKDQQTSRKRIRIFDNSDSEDEPDAPLPPKRECPPPEEAFEKSFLSSSEREWRNSGGTLVICPMSVMSQWAAEATTKVNPKVLRVHTYHGADRRSISVLDLRSMDMVITSYSTVASEYKRFGKDSRLIGLDWERLILDEAHIIRNTKTVCYQSVSAIKARNRWALTGTPIQNCALDCFALLKFLRVPNFNDLQQWRRYLNVGMAGHRRMSFLMKPLMLRRTKLQLQEAGEMPALPPLQVKLIDVSLSASEMTVYKILSAISLRIFAQFLSQLEQNNRDLNYYDIEAKPSFIIDEVNNKYNEMYHNFLRSIGYNPRERVKGIVILVLLLRLRQFCCHPGLMVKMLCDESEGLDDDADEEDSMENMHRNINGMGAIDDNKFNPLIVNDEKPLIKEEIQSNTTSLTAEEDEKKFNEIKDDEKKFNEIEDIKSGVKIKVDPVKKEEPNSEEALIEPQLDMKTTIRLLRPSNPIFDFTRNSAKCQKIFDTLKQLLQETSDKIIVVSQWTSFLAMVKQHLELEGHETLEFNGKMDAIQRSQTLNEFNNTNNNMRILLLSLTAGGVGLNLNVANHLLMVDLHWNPQLERQAQDRIYRYGQKKPAFIYRFMCKDTVEQRIKALQDYKMEIANVILNPENVLPSSSGNGLSLKDLKKIFGMS